MEWKVVEIVDEIEDELEKMPGEPLTSLVTIKGEDGRYCKFVVSQDWLKNQCINIGDEWVEDIELLDSSAESSVKQAEWMDSYYEAVDEYLEG